MWCTNVLMIAKRGGIVTRRQCHVRILAQGLDNKRLQNDGLNRWPNRRTWQQRCYLLWRLQARALHDADTSEQWWRIDTALHTFIYWPIHSKLYCWRSLSRAKNRKPQWQTSTAVEPQCVRKSSEVNKATTPKAKTTTSKPRPKSRMSDNATAVIWWKRGTVYLAKHLEISSNSYIQRITLMQMFFPCCLASLLHFKCMSVSRNESDMRSWRGRMM